MIEQIEGFNDEYKVEFNQLNDTLVKVTLIDTAAFKGTRMDWTINLNKRVNK